jgi:hypothetical protein
MAGDKTTTSGQIKTTADLFAERYFQQFSEVRSGGLFGPGRNAAADEPDLNLEAE